jgi:hypothetical protein
VIGHRNNEALIDKENPKPLVNQGLMPPGHLGSMSLDLVLSDKKPEFPP